MEIYQDTFVRSIFSVSELNEQIRMLLEDNFTCLWVEGEVSNLRRPASGHLYFTLKDAKSQIKAVIFRPAIGRRPFSRMGGSLFDLEDGMNIICRARLSVYQPRGEYQLLVDAIEPRGVGALQKAFEQLKARLQAEGLFDSECKRPVPFLPQRIGVITSPTGAVIRDILHVTRRRFPSIDIVMAPVRVQGGEAASEIIQAIEDMQTLRDVDVIIIARGGGSLEDLAPFNDEAVARAIFQSCIPIVSAVGHETDYTIADFAADLRAPTPSAAAELVTPMRTDLIATLENIHASLINQERRLIESRREKLRYIEKRTPSTQRLIADLRLTVGEKLNQMQKIYLQRVRLRKQTLLNLKRQLSLLSPAALIKNKRCLAESTQKGIVVACSRLLASLRTGLAAAIASLDALSPLAVLKRGYSLVRTWPEGAIVRDTESLSINNNVVVTLASGGFHAQVTAIYGSDMEWPKKNLKKP